CEAPVQDADHMRRVRDGGSTSHDNGSGLCAGCSQTKENKGWEHRGNAEFLRVRTPTGHYYTVGVPPLLPGQDVPTRPPPGLKHNSHLRIPSEQRTLDAIYALQQRAVPAPRLVLETEGVVFGHKKRRAFRKATSEGSPE